MSTMIQIRNVPEEVHREVKARAALAGVSMSEFVLKAVERMLERPSREVLLNRIAELPAVELRPAPSEIIRHERDRL